MLTLLISCAPPPETCTACVLEDPNNFAYTAALDVEVTPVAPMTDLLIDWTALTRDIQGHAVGPTDIATARLIAFRDATPAEVADGLTNDDLTQSEVSIYLTCSSEDRACPLSEFALHGSGVDVSQYTEPGASTWLIALSRAQEAGAGAMIFFNPTEGETNTTVAINDASSRLDVEVDLHSLAPVVVEADDPNVTLDWSELSTDGLGNPINLDGIDEVFVARYDATFPELESQVFDLMTLSPDTWVGDVSGARSLVLSDLDGPRPFPGVDATSTWLVALTCSTCTNPAPRFVTVLQGV